MATASIEILCVNTEALSKTIEDAQIGLAYSNPPQSDRSPSIWQQYLDQRKGLLVHIFDIECIGHPKRWAYNILEEEDWKRFRFKSNIVNDVFNIIDQLLDLSDTGEIVFLSDAQWSNPPKEFQKIYFLEGFKKYHDKFGIRFNSAICIRR